MKKTSSTRIKTTTAADPIGPGPTDQITDRACEFIAALVSGAIPADRRAAALESLLREVAAKAAAEVLVHDDDRAAAIEVEVRDAETCLRSVRQHLDDLVGIVEVDMGALSNVNDRDDVHRQYAAALRQVRVAEHALERLDSLARDPKATAA